MLVGAACNYCQPLIRQQVECFILFRHVSFSNLPKWILEVVCTAVHIESFRSLTEFLEAMCDLKSHIVTGRLVWKSSKAIVKISNILFRVNICFVIFFSCLSQITVMLFDRSCFFQQPESMKEYLQ